MRGESHVYNPAIGKFQKQPDTMRVGAVGGIKNPLPHDYQSMGCFSSFELVEENDKHD